MDVQLKKILYIDDDEDLLDIVKLSLEEIGGYSVEICTNGDEGARVADEWQPDLIMLDVMMPDIDGPTTLRHIKEKHVTSKIHVVFLTARGSETHMEYYLSLGAAGTIAKPFNPFTLSGQVDAVWKRLNA